MLLSPLNTNWLCWRIVRSYSPFAFAVRTVKSICGTCTFSSGTINTFMATIDNAPPGCVGQTGVSPTPIPTKAPTRSPTAAPTRTPTAAPVGSPSAGPVGVPTAAPVPAPTAAPVQAPDPTCLDNDNFYLYVNNDPNPVPGCPFIGSLPDWQRDWICFSYWWGPYYCPLTCGFCR